MKPKSPLVDPGNKKLIQAQASTANKYRDKGPQREESLLLAWVPAPSLSICPRSFLSVNLLLHSSHHHHDHAP